MQFLCMYIYIYMHKEEKICSFFTYIYIYMQRNYIFSRGGKFISASFCKYEIIQNSGKIQAKFRQKSQSNIFPDM